jgi:hypothetical protein
VVDIRAPCSSPIREWIVTSKVSARCFGAITQVMSLR